MLSPPSAYARAMLAAARASLFCAAAALPLSTAATNLFAMLAFVCWAVSGEWRPALRAVLSEPPAWLGLALFAALALGIAWSRAPTREAFDTLLKYRELVLFAAAMFLCVHRGWRIRVLVGALAGSIVLLGLSYAVQSGLIEFADERGFSSETNAVLWKNPITHGFMMSLLAYAAAVLAVRLAGWHRWLLAGVAVLAMLNVWFGVQGRTGYVVMALLVLLFAHRHASWKGLAAALVALTLLIGAAWQWAPAFQARVSLLVAEADEYRSEPAPRETSTGYRLHYWKRSTQWLARNPLLGAGTGGWSEAFYESTVNDPPFMHDRGHTHPHNEYVHLAVQLGPLGLVLYLALLWAAFRRAAALPDAYAPLAQGFVIAFAVASLFNDVLRDTTEGHIWALVGGALFGASRALERARA
jgi:O-antigen ligase